MNPDKRIIIIGGGLSGLTLAYLLSKKNINATVLEASPRLGGRIHTINGPLQTPLELGATWFSDMHPNLLALTDELELQKYPQFSEGISLFQTKSFELPHKFFVPEAENPSYRLVGGTQTLIDTLAKKLISENIKLNTNVIAIKEVENNSCGWRTTEVEKISEKEDKNRIFVLHSFYNDVIRKTIDRKKRQYM